MKTSITYYGHQIEAELCRDFLRFHGASPSVEEDISCFRDSGMSGKPVTRLDGDIVAVGFDQLFDYWTEKGLKRA